MRKCLIDVMNRMFKNQNRPSIQNENENHNQQTPTSNIEKSQEINASNGEFC